MQKKIAKSEISKTGLRGEITIPSDKSISHRAVMLSSLADGESIIKNFSSGADCSSTLKLFNNLGAKIEFIDEKTLKIRSGTLRQQSPAQGSAQSSAQNPAQTSAESLAQTSSPIELYCGNSGTTMRLASGILSGMDFASILTGDESLSRRPMNRIITPLRLMGADITAQDGHAPLVIRGRKLSGINYSSPISSAQVKSCVLLAGLNAEGYTVFSEPFISRNHTEIMLKYLGADISSQGSTVKISPSRLAAKNIEIVGDISSASFFIVAGLIVEGSDFVIKNTGINPTRSGILDVVSRMGGNIELLNKRTVSGELCADLRIIYSPELKGCTIEGEDIPRLIDELPVIAVLASQAEGVTTVKDAYDLRNKESDRISALVNELKKIGVKISEIPDGFIVEGKTALKGGCELETYHDHRLAMSFYTAGLICREEILINGFEWTNISFPEFEPLFGKLF